MSLPLSLSHTHPKFCEFHEKSCLPSAFCIGCQSSPCSLWWPCMSVGNSCLCASACKPMCVYVCRGAWLLEHMRIRAWSAEKPAIILKLWNNIGFGIERELTVWKYMISVSALNFALFLDDKWQNLTPGFSHGSHLYLLTTILVLNPFIFNYIPLWHQNCIFYQMPYCNLFNYFVYIWMWENVCILSFH